MMSSFRFVHRICVEHFYIYIYVLLYCLSLLIFIACIVLCLWFYGHIDTSIAFDRILPAPLFEFLGEGKDVVARAPTWLYSTSIGSISCLDMYDWCLLSSCIRFKLFIDRFHRSILWLIAMYSCFLLDWFSFMVLRFDFMFCSFRCSIDLRSSSFLSPHFSCRRDVDLWSDTPIRVIYLLFDSLNITLADIERDSNMLHTRIHSLFTTKYR